MKKIKSATKALALLLAFVFVFYWHKVVIASAFFSSFKIIADGKEYIFYPPEISYGIDGASLLGVEGVVSRIVSETEIPAQDAKAIFNPNNENPFSYERERSGKKIDEKELLKKIDMALSAGITQIKINSKKTTPTLTVSDIKKRTVLIGQFSTDYTLSAKERKNNIELATKFISGAIVYPNQVFSFNDAVGSRSEERGFLSAKIIVDGQFVDGVGGGVCQVSSTLYNAVLLSGLKVVESHNHSLRVDYVKPSFDAMVNEYGSDLRFKNQFDTPVYIGGYADGEKITFKIYGEKGKYSYELSSEVIETIQAESCIKKRITGEEKTVYPKNGLKSEGFLMIYENGKLIEKRKLRTDLYKPQNGVIYED